MVATGNQSPVAITMSKASQKSMLRLREQLELPPVLATLLTMMLPRMMMIMRLVHMIMLEAPEY